MLSWLRQWRAARTARKFELAKGQLEGQSVRELGPPKTDLNSATHQESARVLGRLLNPKATSHTDWTGD